MSHLIRAAALALALGLATPAMALSGPEQPAPHPPPACTGTNLLEAAERANPTAYQTILDRTKAITNAEGLLWRIEKPGMPPSYLFGTIHVTDDRAVAIARSMEKYIEGAHSVATELGEFMSPGMQAALAMKAAFRALTDHTDTAALIPSEEDRRRVADVLTRLDLDPDKMLHVPPWLLVSAFALPPCEFARQKLSLPPVDEVIVDTGKRLGIEVVGLETIDEQLDAIQSLDPKLLARSITIVAQKKERADDIFATLMALYQEQRVGELLPVMEILVDATPEDVAADRALTLTLLEKRNLVMRKRAEPLIDAGPAFIAVGALHLVGEHGLVELFRQDGYTVTRVQ